MEYSMRSQCTIENHVSSILSKLNVESRLEAIVSVQNEHWLINSLCDVLASSIMMLDYN